MMYSDSRSPSPEFDPRHDDGSGGQGAFHPEDQEKPAWGLYGLAFGIAACLTAGTQLGHLFVIAPDRLFWSISVLIPVFLGAAYGMSKVVGSIVELRLVEHHRSAAHFALLIAPPTILVTMQLFAGVSLLLWRAGLITEVRSTPPDLWALDGYYFWQLVSAMPVVDVPETLNWGPPIEFVGPLPGALELAFKVILIVPIIGIATGVFADYQDHKSNQARESGKLDVAPHFEGILGAIAVLAGWALIVALVFALLWLGVSPTSPVITWLDAIGVAWLTTVARIVTIVTIFAVFAFTLPLWIISPSSGVQVFSGSIPLAFAAMVGRTGALALIVAIASGLTVTLVSNGASEAIPNPPPSVVFAASVEWYTNRLLAAVPFLDIPSTLDWNPRYDFVGGTSVWLLLILKCGLVLVLLLPVLIAMDLFMKLTADYGMDDDEPLAGASDTLGT